MKYFRASAAAVVLLAGTAVNTSWAAPASADPGAVGKTLDVNKAGNCTTKKTKYRVVSQTGMSTDSNAFKNVPHSVVRVNLRNPGCIIVRFSAQVFANDTILYIRAAIGKDDVAIPNEIQFAAEHLTYSDTHTAAFIFPSQPAGAQTVRMRFASRADLESVTINNFVMTVDY